MDLEDYLLLRGIHHGSPESTIETSYPKGGKSGLGDWFAKEEKKSKKKEKTSKRKKSLSLRNGEISLGGFFEKERRKPTRQHSSSNHSVRSAPVRQSSRRSVSSAPAFASTSHNPPARQVSNPSIPSRYEEDDKVSLERGERKQSITSAISDSISSSLDAVRTKATRAMSMSSSAPPPPPPPMTRAISVSSAPQPPPPPPSIAPKSCPVTRRKTLSGSLTTKLESKSHRRRRLSRSLSAGSPEENENRSSSEMPTPKMKLKVSEGKKNPQRGSYLKKGPKKQRDKNRKNFLKDRVSNIIGKEDALALLLAREFDNMHF